MFGTTEDKKVDITPDDENVLKKLDQDDVSLLNDLNNLKNTLNKNNLDIPTIHNELKSFAKYNNKQNYNYLQNLMCPEKCKGVKIPSNIPIPSCAFQLHNSITLSTNANGNLSFVFNPFYLANSTVPVTLRWPNTESNPATFDLNYTSSFWVNNSATLTGNSSDNNWEPVNIGQDIPNVYDQYRLVSASVVVKYIGRVDIVSGVIGGAIVFNESPYLGMNWDTTISGSSTNTSSDSPDLAKFGNFDLAMDSFYHQENLCLEGLRMLYFPLDNSYEEYVKLNDLSEASYVTGTDLYCCSVPENYYKSGFNFYAYVMSAPASSPCFKLDIYCNFECLPNAQFLNYLPLSISPYHISSQEKQQCNLIIQKKPIMKLNEEEKIVNYVPSIWEKLYKKFKGTSMPGIDKIFSSGVMNNLRFFKSALGVAGTLANMQNAETVDMDI